MIVVIKAPPKSRFVEFKTFEGEKIIWKASFLASDVDDIKNIVSACAAYCSGDDMRCWIDGEEAVLDGDWGLL